MDFKHIPVMLEECIEGLLIKPNGIYVDGTIGGAGHSKEIIKKLSEKGLLIGIDRDEEALEAASRNLEGFNNYKLVHGNHDEIKKILNDLQIDKVDGILLDLGVSSYQLDEASRGFSYNKDDKLDMRMDRSQKISAFDVVNFYHEKDLANLIYEYGEERFSRQIAKNITLARREKPIETTGELVKIIEKSKPQAKDEKSKPQAKDGHPAKRTFQAIRIEVNNEIKPLYNTVLNSIDCLKSGGRLVIITFHSLEDRAVKKAYQEASGKLTGPAELALGVDQGQALGTIITKKPIEASEQEKEENSRSKSAKVRIFEKN